MSLARLMRTRHATILQPAVVTDAWGNEVEDWSNATEIDERTVGADVEPLTCWLAQSTPQTASPDGVRDPDVSEWLAFWFPGTPITGRDRVRIDGRVFQVKGAPNDAHTPNGVVHHVETRLRLVEG